jgi:hypothetical protein
MQAREETLQGGSTPARMGGVLELTLVISQAGEDMLDVYAFLTVFYNNFTTLLRDFYDSVEYRCYLLYRL